MAEPLEMIFDDGTKLPATRCKFCQTPMILGYRCAGCEAKGYREAAREVRAQMALLSAQLDRWSRD
jgi:hypothetical protein